MIRAVLLQAPADRVWDIMRAPNAEPWGDIRSRIYDLAMSMPPKGSLPDARDLGLLAATALRRHATGGPS